jgi:hypothetical protein
MGSALEALGRPREAGAEFEEALRLSPGFAPGRVALARIAAQLRRAAGAGAGATR